MNLAQCRMARGALDWTTRQLSQASGVSAREVQAFLGGAANVPKATIHRMRRAFEDNGLVFIDENPTVGGVGVRFQSTLSHQ